MSTGLGVATFVFYLVLFIAGGSDVLSTTFHLSVNASIWAYCVLLVVLPPAAGVVSRRLCRDLAAGDRPSDSGENHGDDSARHPEGGRDRPSPGHPRASGGDSR